MAADRLVRSQLANGLEVILAPSRAAPVASFWVFYRVGSRNEVPGKTGVSHWVEHMLFKGTERFPPGEADRLIARAGGVFNAMTWQDWTAYFATLPAERIELALNIESDRMSNARFDDAEVESERTVIISEREGSENNYFYRLQEETQAAAYLAHSYRQPVIGWKEDLRAMTRDDLYGHYERYYNCNNAVAVMTGDLTSDTMLALIEENFGALAPGSQLNGPTLREPEQMAARRVILQGEDPTAYFLQVFHGPRALDPDFFPLVVMDAVLSGAKGMGILGGGGNNRSSRLYRALVETELVADVGSNFGPNIDPGLFSLHATLLPGTTHEQVETVLWQEIERIQSSGVTAAEVDKAAKQTRAQFAYSGESTTYEAYWLGFSEIVANLDWLDNWVEQLTAVSGADVQRVAQHYFRRHKQTVGWYLPTAES